MKRAEQEEDWALRLTVNLFTGPNLPEFCGQHNTATFDAKEHCCACEGGTL